MKVQATTAAVKKSHSITTSAALPPNVTANRSEDKVIFSKAVALLVASKQRNQDGGASFISEATVAVAQQQQQYNQATFANQSFTQHNSHYLPPSAGSHHTSKIDEEPPTQHISQSRQLNKTQLRRLLGSCSISTNNDQPQSLQLPTTPPPPPPPQQLHTQAVSSKSLHGFGSGVGIGVVHSLNLSQPYIQNHPSPIAQSRPSFQQSKLNQLLQAVRPQQPQPTTATSVVSAAAAAISTTQIHRTNPIRNNLVCSTSSSVMDSSVEESSFVQATPLAPASAALNNSIQSHKTFLSISTQPPPPHPLHSPHHLLSNKHHHLKHNTLNLQPPPMSPPHMLTDVSPLRKTRQQVESKNRNILTEGNSRPSQEQVQSQHLLTINVQPDVFVPERRIFSGGGGYSSSSSSTMNAQQPRTSQNSFAESSRFIISSTTPTTAAAAFSSQTKTKQLQSPQPLLSTALQLSQLLCSVQTPGNIGGGCSYSRMSGSTISPSSIPKGRGDMQSQISSLTSNRSQMSINPLSSQIAEKSGRQKVKPSPHGSTTTSITQFQHRTSTPQHHNLSLQADLVCGGKKSSTHNSSQKQSSSVVLSNLSSILLTPHLQQQQHQKNSKSLTTNKNHPFMSSHSPPHAAVAATSKTNSILIPHSLSAASSPISVRGGAQLLSMQLQQQNKRVQSPSASKSPPSNNSKTTVQVQKSQSNLSNAKSSAISTDSSRLFLHRDSTENSNARSNRQLSRQRSHEETQGGELIISHFLEDFIYQTPFNHPSTPQIYFQQFLSHLKNFSTQLRRQAQLAASATSPTSSSSIQLSEQLTKLLEIPLRSLIEESLSSATALSHVYISKQEEMEKEILAEKKHRLMLEAKVASLLLLEKEKRKEEQVGGRGEQYSKEDVTAIVNDNRALLVLVKKQKKIILANREMAARTDQMLAELRANHNMLDANHFVAEEEEHCLTSHSASEDFSAPLTPTGQTLRRRAEEAFSGTIEADFTKLPHSHFITLDSQAGSIVSDKELAAHSYAYQKYLPKAETTTAKNQVGTTATAMTLPQSPLPPNYHNSSEENPQRYQPPLNKEHHEASQQGESCSESDSDVLSIAQNNEIHFYNCSGNSQSVSTMKAMDDCLRDKLKINLGNIHVVDLPNNSLPAADVAVNNQFASGEVFGYHDEFMNRFDEFSQSWRAAIIAERRYQS